MDFSSVLRPQNQTKMHSESLRMKNEQNKLPVDPKTSKLVSAPSLSNQDSENKDPKTSELTKKAPARPGVSRLPVLAKSLCLQTPSNFSQTHGDWEEKPLAGKAKRSKPSTRPVPFKQSQARSSTVDKNQVQTTSSAMHNVHLKSHSINVKPSKESDTLDRHAGSTQKAQGKAKDTKPHLLRHPGLQSTLPSSASTADTCLKNMNLLSLKDPAKVKQGTQVKDSKESTGENFQPDHAAFLSILRNEGIGTADLGSATPHRKPFKYEPQRVSVMRSRKKAPPTTGENFQPDHTAFLSILRNEGISSTDVGSATPQSKPCSNGPLRVSVMKSRQKAAPTTGSSKSVQFSPDAAALQSILQNEGVNAAGLTGATPRTSVCPTGRGTSIYMAQRVPLRKNQAEVTGRAVVTLKETPGKKWTPQRVRDTRHQPISAMKWHQSAQIALVSPGMKISRVHPRPHQEQKVVQRLFDDQEEDLDTDVTQEVPDSQKEQLTNQVSRVEKTSEEEKEEEEEEEEQQTAPFLQEPQRQSVIFFSTGKKFFRAARFEDQESPSDQDQLGPGSGGAEANCLVKPSLKSVQRELMFQKSGGLNPAVALLRKRLPPLEELRMDEEVATYTSMCVPVTPGFVPPRPRCGNPLASILHFEESSRFVPIVLDVSSGPSSPHGFSQKQR